MSRQYKVVAMGGARRYRMLMKAKKRCPKGRKVNDIKSRSLNKKDRLTLLMEKIRKQYFLEDDGLLQ